MRKGTLRFQYNFTFYLFIYQAPFIIYVRRAVALLSVDLRKAFVGIRSHSICIQRTPAFSKMICELFKSVNKKLNEEMVKVNASVMIVLDHFEFLMCVINVQLYLLLLVATKFYAKCYRHDVICKHYPASQKETNFLSCLL